MKRWAWYLSIVLDTAWMIYTLVKDFTSQSFRLTEVFEPGKYKLIDVRMKGFTGIVEVVNEAELLDEVHKHLISAWVRILWKDPAKTEGTIIAGFGRNVGEVKFIE